MNARIIDITHRVNPAPETPLARATYTVPEVAALLGISTAAVYDLLARGEIPSRRLGHRWIIARHRFDTWLNHDEHPAPDRTRTETAAIPPCPRNSDHDRNQRTDGRRPR